MDDDPFITALTAGMLETLDQTFDLARNGEEALALFQNALQQGRPYDVVIMDITIIGGMGGEECLRRLLGLDPSVRAIVATGYDDPERRRQLLQAGFAVFLGKPYRVADLERALLAAFVPPAADQAEASRQVKA